MTVQPDRLPGNLSHIRKLLVDSFNQEELRTLCFDLGVRFDDLGGEGVSAQARELLLRMERTKQTEALLAWVEKERPHVDWREGPTAGAECPYKGLHAFREADAANFFGRDAFTEKLVGAVAKQSLVAVVGPSGSGKSSVVYAGLVPVLRRNGAWQILHFRPGSDPFLALAEGLLPFLDADVDGVNRLAKARELKGYLGRAEKELRVPLADYLQQIREENPETQLLLIVDQFEENYTQVEADVRRDFLDVLLAPGFGTVTHPFATLLLTMRADFMGQALAYPPMVAALQDNDVKIGLMADEELRLAIEQPAKNQGVRFAAGLVGRILEDVGEHAGNLPLLEFALTLLWERQSGGEMGHAAYEAIGGVRGALAQHADETLAKLTKEDPERAGIIQRVMVQLVQPGTGAEDTRRVARKVDLGDVGWALAQRLAAEDARLLVTGCEDGATDTVGAETAETVEVIHEALIQNWGQLQEWMEQDRELRMWQERLRSDLALWQKNEERKGYLLQGAPLTLAEEWLEKRSGDLSPLEIEYIEASLRKRRGDNFRRIGTAFLVAMLLIGASIIVAIIQSQAATDNAIAEATAVASAATSDYNESVARAKEAEAVAARETAVVALAESKASAAALENVVATSEAETLRAEAQTRLANARWLVSQGQEKFYEDPLLGLVLVLEGLALVEPISQEMPSDDFAVLQENILGNSREQIFQWGRIKLLGDDVTNIEIVNDRVFSYGRVTSSGLPELLSLQSVVDGTLIHRFENVLDSKLSPDGESLFINYDGSYELWNWNESVTEPVEIFSLQIVVGPYSEFNSDGSLLFIDLVGEGGWNLIETNGNFIMSGRDSNGLQEFSPKGDRFIIATEDNPYLSPELRISEDGSLIEFEEPVGDHTSWEFSPDGNRLVLFGRPIEFRDTNSGSLLESFESGDVGVLRSHFSPSGRKWLIEYRGNPINELRDGSSGSLITRFEGAISSVEFSPDESLLLITYVGGLDEIRETEEGTVVEMFNNEETVSFTPNGKFLIIERFNGQDGLLEVFNEFNMGTPISQDISDWEVTPNNSRLLIKSNYSTWELIDGDGNIVKSIGAPPTGFGVSGGGFSPQGNFIIISNVNPTIDAELLDVNGNPLLQFRSESILEWGFSSDENETWVWVGYSDDSHELWHTSLKTFIAPLDTNLREALFVTDTETMVALYRDGKVYLIDLAWLEAMKGEVATLPVTELVLLACQYPLDNGAFLEHLEIRAALEPYLQQVGLEEPQACQNIP